MNVYVLYVLVDETSKKNSVYLYVWLSGYTYVDPGCGHNFEGVSGSEQNLVGVFYV